MVKIVSIIFIVLSVNNIYADIVFSSNEWDFGTINNSVAITKELVIDNPDNNIIEISIIGTCDCLLVEPEELVILPGEKGELLLKYDPVDDSGEIEKYFIIRTNQEGMDKAFFLVHGFVKSVISIVSEQEDITSGC